MSSFEMRPVAEGDNQGWLVELDGMPVGASSLRLSNERVGMEVNYGMRPEGYDGVVVRERGGGGTVTAPYMVDGNNDLYVGLVLEERKTDGGYVWNVPRGMMEAGESKEETASREFAEETGWYDIGSRIVELANGINPNSAIFDTTDTEAEPNAGISFYGLRFEESELVRRGDDYKFPDDVQPIDNSRLGEKIITARFKRAEAAIETSDMFTIAAVGMLALQVKLATEKPVVKEYVPHE